MVRLAPTVHLSCTNTNRLQIDQNEVPHDPRHLEVPSSASRMISEPLECSAQTVNLSCIKINTISKWTKTSFHLSLLPRSTIRCVQNNFWAYGTFTTNHAPILPDTNTVSKWTELMFHMTSSPRSSIVCIQNDFLSLWYVRCKSCTYLESWLALSPNWLRTSFHLSLVT